MGRPTGSPLRIINPRIWFGRCARPFHGIKAASWFLSTKPLPLGRAPGRGHFQVASR
jgi:hypothetical protein